MLGVKVAGGTGAGSRIVKEREPWPCACLINVSALFESRRWHPGSVYSCPDCGARRPA